MPSQGGARARHRRAARPGRPLVTVKQTRHIDKRTMIHNHALPEMVVDLEIYQVRADGSFLTCEAATLMPLAQRYFLY